MTEIERGRRAFRLPCLRPTFRGTACECCAARLDIMMGILKPLPEEGSKRNAYVFYFFHGVVSVLCFLAGWFLADSISH